MDNVLNLDLETMPFFDLTSDGPTRRILGQNLTTWAIGFSNRNIPGRIRHIRTAEGDVFIFRIKTYKSEARSRTAYLVGNSLRQVYVM